MPRKLLGLVILVLIAQMMAGTSFAQMTLWRHGDTIARLLSEGQSRRLIVEAVGKNLPIAEPGSILFDGRRMKGQYIGLFTSFHKCGHIPYPILGTVSADQRSISFQGKEPQIGDDCRIVGWVDRSFDVVFLKPVPEGTPVDIVEQDFQRYPEFGKRAYLREPTRKWEIILDVQRSRALTGVAVNASGTIAAIVRGVNDSPRHLALEFLAQGAVHKGRYVAISDDYDSPMQTYFIESRLKKISGDVDAAEVLHWCDEKRCKNFQTENISAAGFGGAISWIPDRFTSPVEGNVVLVAPGKTRTQILQTLTQLNVPAKIKAVFEDQFTVRVPGGSEQWVIKNLPGKGGIQGANYEFGPSGGSGTVRQSFADGTLISSWSPGVGAALWSQAACKLKSALAPHFRSTAVKQCKRGADTEIPELCFDATVEGHTAEQGVFLSTNLQRKLDNQFLVRSGLEFTVMKIPSPYSPTGFVERLVYYVKETRVARQGPSDPAEKASFTDVERKRISISNSELDDIIVGEIQEIIVTASFECKSGI